MSGHTQIKIFEEKKVRTIWDAEKEEEINHNRNNRNFMIKFIQ